MRNLIACLLLLSSLGAASAQMTLSYPAPFTLSAGQITPFSGVVIQDMNSGATQDVITITISGDAGGTLSGAGLSGTGPYTLTGTPANISSLLQALTYTPATLGGSVATFTIAAESRQTIVLDAVSGRVVLSNLQLTDETPFPAPTATFTPTNFKGVNISGGENSFPTNSQWNFAYPQDVEIDYWSGKGMGLIRMPVSLRRLQPVSYGPLDPIIRTDGDVPQGYRTFPAGSQTNLLAIKAVLDKALSKNMWVILEPHDYGGIKDTVTGTNRLIGRDAEATAQFVDWWTRVATKFKNYPNVIFNLMNEPNAQTPSEWKTGAVAAINAIAQAAPGRRIFIPGTSWTGAQSWVSSGNGAAWAGYVPPAGTSIAFDVHYYLDSDYSGTHAACAGRGSSSLTAAVAWAMANNVKLHIGEIGWSTDPTCTSDAAAVMSYVSANPSAFLGWAYWNGGSNLFFGAYMFRAQPTGYPTGQFTDAPQTSILVANL